MTFHFRDEPAIALDTETTGLNWPEAEMFSFSITTPQRSGYYDIRERPESISWLRDELARYKGLIIFFNASFDIKMFASKGVIIPLDKVHDIAIRECLIDEHRSTWFPWSKKKKGYSLDSIASDRLGQTKENEIYVELARIFGGLATRNVQMPRLHRAPPSLVEPYAIKDTKLTFAVYFDQEADIKSQGLEQVAEFERRTFPHVLRQESSGIRVDCNYAEEAANKLDIEIDREKAKIRAIVGAEININSPAQVRKYYNPQEDGRGGFTILDGQVACGKTAKGNVSIDSDVLHATAVAGCPLASQIIKVRSLIRTCDTFLRGHILGSAIDGRVYPNINQVAGEDGGTKTGRFSYTSPALQQIPNRDKKTAAIVKPCFLPEEGHMWLDGDLNSFEVRVFAHLVGMYNQALVDIYADDPMTDFHQYVSDLMGVPRNPQAEGGANAKQLNLSMIFNSGRGAIANQLGLPTSPASFEDDFGHIVHYHKSGSEGNQIIDAYHGRVQGVQELVNAAKNRANKRGYIKTMYGRHLRFPRGFKDYKASGILIQATAADINKHNWEIIEEELGDRGRLLLNTHDSYSMSVEEGLEDSVWKDVKNAVETAKRPHELRVPMILDKNGCGPNWWMALQG